MKGKCSCGCGEEVISFRGETVTGLLEVKDCKWCNEDHKYLIFVSVGDEILSRCPNTGDLIKV
jgi:hypothetical protein